MSLKRISAVWDHSKAKGNARLLMLALADSANDDGYCWPGYNHIQKKMNCGSRGTVSNTIEAQENAQELIVDHRPNQGNKYLVIVGFSPEQVRYGLRTYFGMNEIEVETAYQKLKERGSNKPQKGNKSKKRTNAISPKTVLNKSRKRTGTSLKTVLDPSITVIDPSIITDPSGSGGDPPKAATPRKRSAAQLALDGMKNAIADAFGLDHDKVTATKWSEFGRAGKELLEVGATPEDMKLLHAWCTVKGWENFTSIAMAKEYATWDKARRASNINPPTTTTASQVMRELLTPVES